MPAKRPRASFEPISPHFDLRDLVETTENFQYVDRISCETIEEQGLENFEKLILLHVVIGGKPLVVDGFEDRLDPWIFTPKWLRDNHGEKVENARNITAGDNLPLTIAHYLKNLGRLTDQYFEKPDNYKEKSRQRIYLKDIDCPPVWQEKLKEHIPASLFYWNDSTGEVGGPGAVDEPIPNGAGKRMGKGIAIAGDLMSSLPQEMRAENLMCYIGHEGTYTPAHREMCASLGHNIMVNASEAFDENGQPEKPGSSIWFMTESKDRHTVAEYWLSVLGHDIEVENHFAQLVAWQRAPFKVYVVEQKAGDFILIPPLAPHQVWNRGTRTMKVAWNRTTVETLEMAMKEALPNARMVCRDEQYKNKTIIYFTLLKYSALLNSARMQASRSQYEGKRIFESKKVRQVQKDFKRLFEMFKNIMISESFAPGTKEQCEFLAFDSNVTCAYCRGNIFNRFVTCKTCMDMLNTGTDEPYDVCMDCFAMGRSCACQSKYKWVEQWKWKDLVARYDEWRKQIIEIDGGMTGKTPLSLEDERELYPKRTLAQVCQEQLKLRPWVDVKQGKEEDDENSEEEEIQVNEDGTVKKLKKKRPKSWYENHKACHVCCHRHPKWMMAMCTMCERGWCYGSLWRAHDLMPQTVMEDLNWECPHCRRVCSTGACRKDSRQKPYEPKGTLLGHDTKKVADIRSVECLVDFSVSNLSWLKEPANAGPQDSLRLKKKREEAERAKLNDPTLDDRYANEDEDEGIALDDNRGEIEYSPTDDLIDPALGGGSGPSWRPSQNGIAGSSFLRTDLDAGADMFDQTGPYYPEPDPGMNGGFVAPAAVMYRVPEPLDGSEINDQVLQSQASNKRSRPDDGEQIKLVTSKKRKVQEDERPQPKNKASKQYQVAQESKRLEEARKAGRFIQVLASIRGRKKIVVLKIDGHKLAKFAPSSQTPPDSFPYANNSSAQNILLRSDIAPPRTGFQAINSAPQLKKTGKQFRVRVEDDDDFQSWERSERRRRPKKRFEEITVDSNEETEDEAVTSANQRKGRRNSQWLARKHQGEEGLPDELPSNFKDGLVNPRNRNRDPNRRKTMPAGPPQAQKKPRIQPVRASTGGIEDVSDNLTPQLAKKGRGRPSKAEIAAKATELAKAAVEEEENRRAKLEAAGLVDKAVSSSETTEEESSLRASKVNQSAASNDGPSARKSILTRKGPGGKKIKITERKTPVSARSKVTVSGVAASKANEKQNAIDISDGESSSSGDEEIPANLPVRKGPPGRTSLSGVVGNKASVGRR